MLQGCAATAVKFDKASLRSPAHVAKPCGRESSIHIFISDKSIYLKIYGFHLKQSPSPNARFLSVPFGANQSSAKVHVKQEVLRTCTDWK